MTLVELRALLLSILEISQFDYCGLYETFWLAPPGDIHNNDLRISKKYALEQIASVNFCLCEKGYCLLMRVNSGSFHETDDLSELNNVQNYEPFTISSDTGYALSATAKGIALRKRLLRKTGMR